MTDRLAEGRRLHEAGRLAEAETAYRAVLADDPANARARYLLGVVLTNARRIEDALAYLEEAVAAFPEDAEVWNNRGNALRLAGRHEDALRAFDRAIALDADFAGIHVNRGTALRQMGRLDDAQAAYRRALAVDPDLIAAYNGLSRSGRSRLEAADVERLARAIAAGRLTGNALADAAYALGKHYHEAGDAEAAARMYRRANGVKRGRFDAAPFAAELDATLALAPPPGAKGDAGGQGPRPVFVVGMPRSGTTLVEQILASHPGVVGLGETNAVERWLTQAMAQDGVDVPGGAWPARAAEADLSGLADTARSLPAAAGAEPPLAFVEKSPFNDRFIDPILRAVPDARFVVCTRDARDVRLSIYFTDFSRARPFATEMAWIKQVQDLHARRIAHWRARLKDRLVEVAYETLVSDPEPAIRALLAALSLPWDDACLRPEGSKRAVLTPSDWQVRMPINRGSVGRWKTYAPWLPGLDDGAGSD